ncbi:MAG: hypothetical protein M3381_11355 [Actinomycetota bacterium]|nr:hypothetical protein [Actinomycetota bacterium]
MGDPTEAASAQPGGELVKIEPAPVATRVPDKKIEDLDIGWGERPRDVDRLSADDERLLRERPPHWE